MIEIYCDGACSGNPGPGGWGIVYVDKERDIIKKFYGHAPETTNNQMELSAAIFAAQLAVTKGDIVIYTDSNYVVKGISDWISGWKKKGWKTTKNEPVKNMVQWKELDSIASKRKNVSFQWVKGHSGVWGNEQADEQANRGLDGEDNYEELMSFVNELENGPTVQGKKRNLTDGNQIFTFIQDVIIYPNIKGYLLKDSKGRDVVFNQSQYDALK